MIYFLVRNVKSPAADGAKMVLIIAWAADFQFPSVTLNDEPPLKNIHPTQRIKVPKTTEFGDEAENPFSPSVS